MDIALEEIKTIKEELKRSVSQGLQGVSTIAKGISAAILSEVEAFFAEVGSPYAT